MLRRGQRASGPGSGPSQLQQGEAAEQQRGTSGAGNMEQTRQQQETGRDGSVNGGALSWA